MSYLVCVDLQVLLLYNRVAGQSFFASAPPLGAFGTVLSMAMSRIGSHVPDWNPLSAKRTQISLVDIKRAYFNAEISQKELAHQADDRSYPAIFSDQDSL